MFSKKKLPHCDELFEKYLSPWYPEDPKPRITRPDMYIINGFKGEPIDLNSLQYLDSSLLERNKSMVQKMTEAALNDYQPIIKSDKLTLEVLNAVDKFYDRKQIAELIKESEPGKFSTPYLVKVCEFGATLGYLFNEIEGFGWLYSHPYFHSMIVHQETGWGITVFDWAVKKFSEYGVDDGFVDKFHAAIKSIKA